ncbi:MAG: oxygen-independent coproporphyrinogen III oxidase [Litoreibacter sp.]|uniref:oxygen-independent coproporphyrinogen III oxidase n=1 Tax=Litoreibacter sp. TaxID=1969459 RepID=UPI003297CA33
MENYETLSRHGLFDVKVPRYTSYPPANHFQPDVGHRCQKPWIESLDPGEEVSIYIHIPFCKRLCWFCACRTQGTKTLRPVDAYVAVLKKELRALATALPGDVKMRRLHLGGGTPTILSAETMADLLSTVFDTIPKASEFEFSVEIDPTEAKPSLLQTLIEFGMNRASIGVQDFEPTVQKAIGRLQTLSETNDVIAFLRKNGVKAINLDLLYGLPHQTSDSFRKTLDHVVGMDPDRLAIYGYAHVPWMSKRQILIKPETLPDTKMRFELACSAADTLCVVGFNAIGIDHFAKPTDSLYLAHQQGNLRRNFQGYTDDQSQTLIGLGASAISRFKGGYVQNAVATSAYLERILATGFAGHKGYQMTANDDLVAAMIEALMCQFNFPVQDLKQAFPDQEVIINQTATKLMTRYSSVFQLAPRGLEMSPGTYPLARIIAKEIDAFVSTKDAHATAI